MSRFIFYKIVNHKNSSNKKVNNSDLKNYDFIENKVDSDNNMFLNSLEELTPDKIAPEIIIHRRLPDLIKDGIRHIILIVCIVVFICSLALLANSIIGYIRGAIIYDEISNEFDLLSSSYSCDNVIEISVPLARSYPTQAFDNVAEFSKPAIQQATPNNYNVRLEKIKLQLKSLEVKYPDLVGWITIDNTNINYPVVQGEDNDYYLSHAPNGMYLPAGSIFLDYRCDKSLLKNHNTVIYGHRMSDTSMFNHVKKYLDKDFFYKNPYIIIKTTYGIFKYEIFAIYETDMYYKYITTNFSSHKEFVKFAYEMKSNSLYERKNIEFTESDRILTLSTCTGIVKSGRYTLQAKLISIEK